jgi:hypothetical protein
VERFGLLVFFQTLSGAGLTGEVAQYFRAGVEQEQQQDKASATTKTKYRGSSLRSE